MANLSLNVLIKRLKSAEAEEKVDEWLDELPCHLYTFYHTVIHILWTEKLAKIYYSPEGYWKGIAAIKKLSEAAMVSEETAKKWLVKQVLSIFNDHVKIVDVTRGMFLVTIFSQIRSSSGKLADFFKPSKTLVLCVRHSLRNLQQFSRSTRDCSESFRAQYPLLIIKDAECSMETKRCVAHSKSPGANEQKFAVFLLLAWLIEI